MLYRPSGLLVTFVTAPVSTAVRVTSAPGITAPLGSVIVPASCAPIFWAVPTGTKATRASNTNQIQFLVLMPSCEQNDTLSRAIPSPGLRPPSPPGRGAGGGAGGEGFAFLRPSMTI